ncbi:hypothetical protein HMPREF9442_00117 [Paraprevotella xylaniphila YIT 11841]|uniref:Uncharacterized protein n=1 Tax=Paraprevotella xylaniphila YIT 11841 TaxID=762982 RepID=F3QPN0_9BACT|nr:hypothetical protein HMPREF9442_00117 [Paraprevotella xylaniphila YIT 11841]
MGIMCVCVFLGCFLSQYKSSVFCGINAVERLPKWQKKSFSLKYSSE